MIYRKLAFASFLLISCADVLASSASITVSRDAQRMSSPNTIDVALRNDSDHDIFVVAYNSVLAKPDGRTTGNWLQVTDSFGHEVPYVGRFVVAGPLNDESFLRISPGASVKESVDLSVEYSLPPAGSITVRTTMAVYNRVPATIAGGEREDVRPDLVSSGDLTIHVTTLAAHRLAAASTLQCTAEQVDMTRDAVAAARAVSDGAGHFLGTLYYADAHDPANPVPPRVHMRPHHRYTNWFGTWDDAAPQPPQAGADQTDNARVDQTVVAVYMRLMSGVNTACDECKGYNPLTRAWAEGKLIHLCPSNFGDPITGGITSQAGTIVHEVSHQGDMFARGTVDLPGVNSRNDAHRLARPSAVQSAANYEYFITDTPLGR